MHDYAIVANGDFLSKQFIVKAIQNKKLIALDGAADKLLAMDIKPDIILGDFDSISLDYRNLSDVKIIHMQDQNLTDFQKALVYCNHHQVKSITVLCALGGRMDHHEINLRTLRKEFSPARPIYLHTSKQTIRFCKDEVINFKGNLGDKCGLLAYPKATATSDGLCYELTHYSLEFAESESIANSLAKKEVQLQILGEALVVMPLQI